MDENVLKTMTTFDSLLQSQHLQMLKAAIPYLSGNAKNTLSILCKLLELKKTIQMSVDETSALSMCSVTPEEGGSNILLLLKEIRPYCTKAEQENVDFFVDVFQMYETYASMLT
ncbi:hypothetical protein SAMN02910358_00222 [Lachnospiraceae bacterium XBB1006]|nr:hypothetical protein SAMN02910358_00222 [Lachnospiraceae bacterium XBB1006]